MKNLLVHPDVLSAIQSHIKLTYRNSPSIQEKWLFRYLYIFNKVARGSSYTSKGISINSKNTAYNLGISSDNLAGILSFYKNNSMFFITQGYIPGVSSYKYLIHSPYNTNLTILNMSNPFPSEINPLLDSPFFSQYWCNLKEIVITIPFKLLTTPNKLYTSTSYDTMLDEVEVKDLESKEYYLSQPVRNSRVYHNLCNLKREYRASLSWEDSNIQATDVVGSQIFLGLVQYLEQSKIAMDEQPKDIQELYKVCLNGTFYETMMAETKHKDRKAFKVNFFKSVYFNKPQNMVSNNVGKAFLTLYPTMHEYIRRYKETQGYTEFAIRLQALEWELMEEVLRILYKEGFKAINLHDAILYPASVANETVEGILIEVYNSRFGVSPKVTSELF